MTAFNFYLSTDKLGGGGVSQEIRGGMCCLFQINTYEAIVKEYSQGVFVVMVINTINKHTI